VSTDGPGGQGDLEALLDEEVDWARRRLQNAEQRKDLDQEREAAERVRERLRAAGLTDEQIHGLGVTEHSMKAVTRLRRKP
jgi:hypothetical protein